jgi:hypothetical protein
MKTDLLLQDTEEYIDYYTFFYSKNYRGIYKKLYKKYKEEYSVIVLEQPYGKNDKICDTHQESIQFHFEFKNNKNDCSAVVVGSDDGTYDLDCCSYY